MRTVILLGRTSKSDFIYVCFMKRKVLYFEENMGTGVLKANNLRRSLFNGMFKICLRRVWLKQTCFDLCTSFPAGMEQVTYS